MDDKKQLNEATKLEQKGNFNKLAPMLFYIKKQLALIDKVISDSKKLSSTEFEKEYKENPIEIILKTPDIVNDSISLYRSRLAKDIDKDEDLSDPATFSYVPLTMNKEGFPKMGRANYKGQSIFYASEHIKTNFREISKDCNIKDEAYLAKWNLKPNSNLHLYRTIPNWGISTARNQEGIFTINIPEIVNSDLGKYLEKLGKIMMSNEETGKYLGSSLISNCIYDAQGVLKDSKGNVYDSDIYYDGIAYPSATGETDDVNLALKPQFVDRNMELEYVIKGRLAADMRSVEFEKIGLNEEGRINWYALFYNDSSILITDVTYRDVKGNFVDVSKGLLLDANNVVTSARTALTQAFEYHHEEMFRVLAKLVQINIKENQKVTKSSLEKIIPLRIIRGVNGWKFVDGDNCTPLIEAVYNITLKIQLREISTNSVR